MKCYTIQSKEVLNILKKNGIYYTDRLPEENNLSVAYKFAKEVYGFNHIPIFLVPNSGVPITVFGCKTENSIGLELDIPDEYIKIQDYYNWTDTIYFLEFKDEFYEVFDLDIFSKPEEFGKDTLLNSKLSNERPNQLMTEYLRYKWVIDVYDGLELCKIIDESTYNIEIMKKGGLY